MARYGIKERYLHDSYLQTAVKCTAIGIRTRKIFPRTWLAIAQTLTIALL